MFNQKLICFFLPYRDSEWDRISENLVSLAGNVSETANRGIHSYASFIDIFVSSQRFFALFEITESLGSQPPDPELRDLVYVCTRREGTFRDRGWSLKDLDDRVQRGFERGTDYYKNAVGIEAGAEDDDAIVAVVRDVFFNAEDSGSSESNDFPGPPLHPDDSDLSL